MHRIALIVSVLGLSLIGCNGNYAEDIKTICNAKELSGVAGGDPSQAATRMAKFLEGELKTKKAKQLLADMGTIAPEERGPRLRAESEKAGLDKCALADER